ncbi:MAG: hypothetical protein H6945_18940 [Zoogloeaceae bacterium]|nr:hypothetical protein [Rhodocyclaceae bacterium]MCP5237812.1 hypothetical protein [Zoogloeaceae bacterium]
MPNLPAVTGRNHRTKAQLVNYVADHLQPGLDNHRLLKHRLQAGLDDWLRHAQRIDDEPPAKLTEPVKDHFVDPAFRNQHEQLAKRYFERLDKFSRAEPGSKGQGKAARQVRTAATALEQSTQAYDLKLRRYEDAYERYQLEQEHPSEYDKRIAPYQKEIQRLRSDLARMVNTYNDDRCFDEIYDGDDYRTDFRQQYQRYVPTQHAWFADVQGGTYIYDYQHNQLQLHLHFDSAQNKVTAVRIKRYGDQHGVKADKNWGMVEHVRQKYPCVWQRTWTQVAL